MIDIEISIRRGSGLWGGVSPETVQRHQKELEELKEKLKSFSFLHHHNLFGSKELMEKVSGVIEQEIKYCLFYDEHRNRQANEPNLGEWVFTKQEDIKPKYSFIPISGEQWTKTNGRVKAIIQFDRTGLMVKITLQYENDSPNLSFCEQSRYNKPKPFHLKSEDSINTKIQELKNEADAFLKEHQYPLYSTYEIDLLKQLLFI